MVELSLGRSLDDNARLGYAGDALNTAIYLKRGLGNAGTVAYVSALGDDPLSDRMIDFMGRESLETEHIKRRTGRLPGLYAINTDDAGERTFSYWRSESAARSLFQSDAGLDFHALQNFDVLYLSAITLAILPSNVRDALLIHLKSLRDDAGQPIVFDSNSRPRWGEDVDTARASVADAWRACSIALPSVDDEMELFGDRNEAEALDRLRSYGIDSGAMKRGEKGPLSLSGDTSQTPFVPPETRVVVVDTTAAGDSFNAGYLTAVLSGHSNHDALHAGHALACKVIGHRGAIIPDMQEP